MNTKKSSVMCGALFRLFSLIFKRKSPVSFMNYSVMLKIFKQKLSSINDCISIIHEDNTKMIQII